MYHCPEIHPFWRGEPLTVTDLLADGLSLEAAYAQVPADLRCDSDPELDDHLPWRRPAAVLHELHRTRAAQVLAARPCRQCAAGLAAELLVPVAHPSDPGRTVTLLDALLDFAGGLFELVAGRESLQHVVDLYVDSPQARSSCQMHGCPEAPDQGQTRVSAFSVGLLGLLASWAYEAGVSRDIDPVVSAAWTEAVDELAGSPGGGLLSSGELLEQASLDPRVVAAEASVPERWAQSDWGTMALLRGESPTFTELRAELGVSPQQAAVGAVEVANWLADRVGHALAD